MKYPHPEDKGQTHFEGCWRERGHHNCAVAEIERLQDKLDNEQAKGIHSCGPNCQREVCVLRREIEQLKKGITVTPEFPEINQEPGIVPAEIKELQLIDDDY